MCVSEFLRIPLRLRDKPLLRVKRRGLVGLALVGTAREALQQCLADSTGDFLAVDVLAVPAEWHGEEVASQRRHHRGGQVARAFEQIESNRLQDRTRFGESLVSLASLKNEMAPADSE